MYFPSSSQRAQFVDRMLDLPMLPDSQDPGTPPCSPFICPCERSQSCPGTTERRSSQASRKGQNTLFRDPWHHGDQRNKAPVSSVFPPPRHPSRRLPLQASISVIHRPSAVVRRPLELVHVPTVTYVRPPARTRTSSAMRASLTAASSVHP